MHSVADSSAQTRRQSQVPWTPTADIATIDGALVLRAELPGVAHDDVEVDYAAPTLTISGQRQRPETEQQATYHTEERHWGRFHRSVHLPEGIGRDDFSVELTDGVLEVTIHGYSRA